MEGMIVQLTPKTRLDKSSANQRLPKREGFTLIEILIVVVILGILAAIVIPLFSSATTESQNNSMRMDLQRIRTQLELYRNQHNQYPQMASFGGQLTQATDDAGNVAAPGTAGFKWGPYLLNVPNNPNTSDNSIGNGAVGTSSWYYDETSGEFRANDSATTRAY
jgi:general secretion pathway protein G